MSGGGCSRKPVKIVIISTQYVETDATSFKSVVQKLTGKDSDHRAASESESASAAAAKTQTQREGLNRGSGVEVPAAGGNGSSFLIRDLSFKEFDRFLGEMPSINELWSDEY